MDWSEDPSLQIVLTRTNVYISSWDAIIRSGVVLFLKFIVDVIKCVFKVS